MTQYLVAFDYPDNYDPPLKGQTMVVARRASVEVREFLAKSTE
jgi:hypothetical protein